MRFLHSMLRVRNLDDTLSFFCGLLNFKEIKRYDSDEGKFTLVFLHAPGDEYIQGKTPLIELTYNWPDENNETEQYSVGRSFGHLAFEVDNIYDVCEKVQKSGVVINRPPRDGRMAFLKTPDGISIELLQKGNPLKIKEPWSSMESIGVW